MYGSRCCRPKIAQTARISRSGERTDARQARRVHRHPAGHLPRPQGPGRLPGAGALRPRRQHPRLRPAHRPGGRAVLPAHPLRPRRAAHRPRDARAVHRRGRRALRHGLADLLLRPPQAHGDLRLAARPLPLRPAAAPPRRRARLRHPADRQQPRGPAAGGRAVRDRLPSLPDHRRDQARARRSASSSCWPARDIDLVVLARYMQVLSESFVDALPEPHHQHPPLVPAGLLGRPAPTTGPTAAA